MSYHQPFFVGSNDIHNQETAKALARHLQKQQQLCIAEEMSEIAREEYQDDHLRHMLQMEVRNPYFLSMILELTHPKLETIPDVASIDVQTEIQWYMRPYLLDFLIEAHAAFALLPETLFLTVNILDRYCSRRIVYRKHYQLVGVTSLLIAAKYGDAKEKVPTIRELSKMCCSLYEEQTFTEMEWHVLQTLDWAIGHPTVDGYFQLLRDGPMFDSEAENLARYISEMAMFHKEFISKPSSEIARASLALSRHLLRRNQPHPQDWEAEYSVPTMTALSELLWKPSNVLAQKYASSHLSRASRIVEQFLARHAAAERAYAAVPPTPPSATFAASVNNPAPYTTNAFQTPQKSHYPANMPNGALTPPITPEEHFAASNGVFPRQCAGTPTPLRNQISAPSRSAVYYPGLGMM
ncbi:MAG: hypothetical protein Q9187_007150 [Circinaria calcarea]